MKRFLSIANALVLGLCFLFSACEKEAKFSSEVHLESFTFEPAANEGLARQVSGVIEGNEIFIRVPNSIDISKAVPSFTSLNGELVGYIGNTVQESGVTPVDLSAPVKYRFVTKNGLSEYMVHGLKSASIVSFGFFAADNAPYLFRDYKADIKKLAIHVDLPINADITKLKARIITTEGAVVQVNGQDFISGGTALDYTTPQTLSLTDAESTIPEEFVVTVGRQTAPVWSRIAMPAMVEEQKIGEVTMEIHPITNQPYLMFRHSGTTVDSKVAMVAFNAETKEWSSLGAISGFSEARADLSSLAFSSDGVPYAAYRDHLAGTNAQYASVQKYENNTWVDVVPKQSSYDRVNYLSLVLDEQNTPYLGYVFTRAAAPYVNRATYAESFRNNTWTGSTFPQSSTGFFARMVKGQDNKLYYLTMDLSAGTSVRKPSVYRLENGNWTLIGKTLVGPANSNSGNIYCDLDATPDGQIYLVYQSNSPAYVTYVMHWDGTSWKQLGDGFAQTTNSSANRDNVALKVHPDGTIYVAYGDAVNGVKVTTFNKTTNNWNTATQLANTNGDKYTMRIAKDGIPYLVTMIDGKIALFKYDIPGL